MYCCRWYRAMGDSFNEMIACQDRDTRRKLKMSDSGNETMICVLSSLGSDEKSWSKGGLDGRQ